VATLHERKPGVWEVRVFIGADSEGRPTQVSRSVRGTKRDAQRVAAELTLKPSRAAGRTVAAVLDRWLGQRGGVAPASRRDQASRAEPIKTDPIGRMALARVTVADVDRRPARLRKAGVGQAAIRNRHTVLRAALSQAVRWGWVTTNVATSARLAQRKVAPREVTSAADVRAVLAAAAKLGPAPALALRLVAVTGARRAELAALRWDDLEGDRLRMDSSVAILRPGPPGFQRRARARRHVTKTANRRIVKIDATTVSMWEAYKAGYGIPGDWVFGLFEPANPDRIGWWWRRPGSWPGSTLHGGSTISATGRPPRPSAAGTT
jgi:integrase